MENSEYLIEAQKGDEHWWYRGRRKLLEGVLRGRCGQSCGVVFDVGCGVGNYATSLRKFSSKLIGIDAEEVALEFCKTKPYDALYRSGAEDLEARLQGERADVVVAMDVLEHLDDDLRGVRAIASILKDGGWAFITVPAFQCLWGLQDDVSHHRRRYGKKHLVNLCENAGLNVERVTYFNAVFFLPIALARWAMRVWRPQGLRSENEINSTWINSIAAWLFGLDVAWVLKGGNLPFGVSLLAIVRKK